MNSVEELSTYDLNYFKNSTGTKNSFKTAATTYDFPEHAPSIKKDRKWSFGNLFRRKKKDDTDSSSNEEIHKKNFLNRKNKHPKCDKRKKTTKQSIGGAFDHIVTPPASHNGRQSHLLKNGLYRIGSSFEDAGILSDPSGCFDSYIGRPLPRPPNTEMHIVNKQQEKNRSHNSLGSVDSLSKKSRKVRTMARAVARRDSINHASSSDEEDDSQRSSSSRFRSDESLAKHQHDVLMSRRSRTARTERYIRRLSKDDESILNREAMQRQARENWQMKVREDYSPSANSYGPSPRLTTPPQYRYNHIKNNPNNNYNYNPCVSNDDLQSQFSQPNFSGLFTIPPSHSNIKYRNSNSHMQINQPYDDDVHSSRLSMNQQPSQASSQSTTNSTCFNIRSLSCDSNIHKSPSPDEIRTAKRDTQRYRNLSLVEQPKLNKQPPPPPPRDPRRVMYHPNNHTTETRPSSQWYPVMKQPIQQQYRRSQFAGYRTNSEDVIPTFSEKAINLEIRPASVTNETRKRMCNYRGNSLASLSQQLQDPEKFKYMTEKRPRSRKPIFIQSTDRINTNNYNSSSSPQNGSSNSLNWKPPPSSSKSSDATRKSPQIFTAQTHVQTKIFLPSTLIDANKQIDTVDSVSLQAIRQNSPFKPISSPTPLLPDERTNSRSEEPNEENKRKSANLEEALDELEAIYKSLHLGDEDLLERAEQREMSIAAKKLADSKNETYSGMSRGAMSDSSFSYEPFNAIDTPKKKVLKKARTLDRKNDDMAFRKMSKDNRKSNTINTNFSSLANVSYLLASPVHFESLSPKNEDIDIDEVDCGGGDDDDDDDNNYDDGNKSSEPDITLDDVVYRNVKHANNTLKVADPQPPFGIPIGPVTLASNSDYLHAVPENTNYLPYVKKNRIPDIVKDDLAYRNLRKDPNKEPALKPVSPVDFDNNNIVNKEKKKRAVRSLSANISNLINLEQNKKMEFGSGRISDCENEFKKTCLTDIADAMEIARQILKEKENRIQATKRAFLSDSESKYRRDVTSASSTETITESRLNFLNEMRSFDNKPMDKQQTQFLQTKPPRGATPDRRYGTKETTPTPSPNSPGQEESCKDSLNSSFEELLTALAVEARETSDRITNELNTFDDNLKRKEDTQKKLKEIDSVSEHAKLCEKLLECVVESTELIASTKVESTLVEQVEQIENLLPESVANIVTTRIEDEEEFNNPVDIDEVHSTSEQDYDHLIGSDFDAQEDKQHSKSPFEEHKAELVASFQEMKRSSISSDSDVDDGSIKSNSKEIKEGGEQCADDHNLQILSALPANVAFVTELNLTDLLYTHTNTNINQPATAETSTSSFITNCDIFIDDYSIDGDDDEYDDDCDHDSQPSSGFHSNMSDANCESTNYFSNVTTSNVDQIPTTLLESLESPKLVTSAMKMTENDTPSTSGRNNTQTHSDSDKSIKNYNNNQIPSHSHNQSHRNKNVHESRVSNFKLSFGTHLNPSNGNGGSRHSSTRNSNTKTRTWYGDPIVLAFACSYGVACSYQLASLDVVTILGIIFVIISIAAALILE